MRRLDCLYFPVLIFGIALHPAAAQKFQPKTIQFKGAVEYSDQELLNAAGLKNGSVLSYEDMKVYSQKLMDTGVFSNLAFKFDGQDLIFTIDLATHLHPIRLENIPLTADKELEDKLHERVPLYHGQVPEEGGLQESVRKALEQILAEAGLPVSVVATPFVSEHAHAVSAISYSIASPPVRAAVVHVGGVSDAFQEQVRGILENSAKSSFNTAESAGNLARTVALFYDDRGYAAARIKVTRAGAPSLQGGVITVPFDIQVQEGKIYKLGRIHLQPGTPVTQAEIDKLLAPLPIPGGPLEGARVRGVWALILSRYKMKGNLDCRIASKPEYDEAAGTISYTVSIDPGPVYHLGFVKFDGVSDEVRTQLIHNWQMMPGDPFDEGYVAHFISKVQMQDPVLKRALSGVKVSYDAKADPEMHEVSLVVRFGS